MRNRVAFGVPAGQLNCAGRPDTDGRAHRSTVYFRGFSEARGGFLFPFVFWDQKIQLGCGRGGPPRAYSLVTPVEKSEFSAIPIPKYENISEIRI